MLGEPVRFVVEPLPPGGMTTLRYPVPTETRGRYPLGPMRVRVPDPLGMVALDQTLESTASILVTPRTEPLPRIPLTGRWAGAGDNRTRDLLGGGSPDVTTREYRLGDDLRRIHWPTSARVDQLMVRREEQEWQSRCTLLIDNRRISHRGYGARSSMETAVSAAASILRTLVAQDFDVRLVSATGQSSVARLALRRPRCHPPRAARAPRPDGDDPQGAALDRLGRRVAARRHAPRGPRSPRRLRPRPPGRAGQRRRLGVRRGAGRRRAGTARSAPTRRPPPRCAAGAGRRPRWPAVVRWRRPGRSWPDDGTADDSAGDGPADRPAGDDSCGQRGVATGPAAAGALRGVHRAVRLERHGGPSPSASWCRPCAWAWRWPWPEAACGCCGRRRTPWPPRRC